MNDPKAYFAVACLGIYEFLTFISFLLSVPTIGRNDCGGHCVDRLTRTDRTATMAQATPYTKPSALAGVDQPPLDSVGLLKCGYALGLFAGALRELQDMNNEEREEMMKQLTAWMITDKYGSYARPAIHGLQKYCLAECLLEDPAWKVPDSAGRALARG